MSRKQKCLAALVFLDVLLPIGCGREPGARPATPIFTDTTEALIEIQIRTRRIERRLDDLLREADASVEGGR